MMGRLLTLYCTVLLTVVISSVSSDVAQSLILQNVDMNQQPSIEPLQPTHIQKEHDGYRDRDDYDAADDEGNGSDEFEIEDVDAYARRTPGVEKLRSLSRSTPADSRRFDLKNLYLYHQDLTNAFRPVRSYVPNFSLLQLQRDCPYSRIYCRSSQRFRTADGSCNNLASPEQGMAKTTLARLSKPRYDDGKDSPRTYNFYTKIPVPSARVVSVKIHHTNSAPSTVNSHLLMGFGQFLDHDLTLTPTEGGEGAADPACCTEELAAELALKFPGSPQSRLQAKLNRRPQCFPILVPSDDPVFTTKCMSFIRSTVAPNSGCTPDARQQMNDLSHYIDASNVYGSSLTKMNSLRNFRDGQLRSQIRNGTDYLPMHKDSNDEKTCHTVEASGKCQFDAGDLRNSEQAGLSALHSLWLRVHNKFAFRLSRLNPHWNDETIFQNVRKIVGALLHHITYGEFLPIVLGPELMAKWRLELKPSGWFTDYSERVDASIMNVFATACYRFGHSLVSQQFSMYDKQHKKHAREDIGKMFQAVNMVNTHGVDEVLLGQIADNSESADRFCTRGLRDNLFNEELDLMALNIQRGRDHGLGSYNDYRRIMRLPVAADFNELNSTHDSKSIEDLKHVYPHVEDMEMWPAGLSERPVNGGLVGPLFGNIIALQFLKLKYGDRFWYERRDRLIGFSYDQLREIRRMSFASIYCLATEAEEVPPRLFKQTSPSNPRISCNNFAQMDLNAWRDQKRSRCLYRGCESLGSFVDRAGRRRRTLERRIRLFRSSENRF